MTDRLRIGPDGTVTVAPLPYVLDAATSELGPHCEVVQLHHPLCGRGMVGVVHDEGVLIGLALNEKAWALYGGSPIVGPMWIANDNRSPLAEEFVTLLLGDTDWVGEVIRAKMRVWLAANR